MKRGERHHREYEYIESEDNYEMASQWIDQGNLEKAEACLKRSIELNGNFIYAYITLADIYAKQKRWQDAVSILKKAFLADPFFERLPFMMAQYSREAGDYVSALRFISRAIEIREDQEFIELQRRIYDDMKGLS